MAVIRRTPPKRISGVHQAAISSPSDRDAMLATVLYFLFKIIPCLIACFAIYLGYKLFILGVTGQASLSVNSKDISGQLLNAAPGLFFAIGGVVVLIISVWKSASITSDYTGLPDGSRTRSYSANKPAARARYAERDNQE
ncbi:MAG TPA: hypothetical protein VIW80_16855 [Pyrinomonadaceae bacterium]|jgi:hypothetical protein